MGRGVHRLGLDSAIQICPRSYIQTCSTFTLMYVHDVHWFMDGLSTVPQCAQTGTKDRSANRTLEGSGNGRAGIQAH
jgi:hypothetical protein